MENTVRLNKWHVATYVFRKIVEYVFLGVVIAATTALILAVAGFGVYEVTKLIV